MEIWATVALVLGSNIIVALSTFFTTRYQLRHSDKRFERELEKVREEQERQREIDSSHWRREVRSQPLLRLRDVLARMAARLDKLVINSKFPFILSTITEDAENMNAQALKDLRDYMTSEDFLLIRYLQYDTELVKLVDEIEDNYMALFVFTLGVKSLKSEGLQELMKISQKIKKLIPRVQELINKRLEEL